MPRTIKRKTDNKTSGFATGRQIRRKRLSTPGTREKTQCRFCRNGIKYIDYKDVGTLQKLLTNRGKIYSRKRSGNCAGCQRKAKKAIKRARYIALLPYST